MRLFRDSMRGNIKDDSNVVFYVDALGSFFSRARSQTVDDFGIAAVDRFRSNGLCDALDNQGRIRTIDRSRTAGRAGLSTVRDESARIIDDACDGFDDQTDKTAIQTIWNNAAANAQTSVE